MMRLPRTGWSAIVLLGLLLASVTRVQGQDGADVETMMRSVVQIVTFFCDTPPPDDGDDTETPIDRDSDITCDDERIVGSGTIIGEHGTILTNNHVVRPWEHGLVSADYEGRAGWHLVLETVDPRQAALPVFFARVTGSNADVDLATIVPSYTRDGESIDRDDLDMSAMPTTDPRSVQMGDRLHLLGYAEAGGDQISYSAGTVTGFAADSRVPDLGGEAWIRTDASLQPAASGGTAADVAGHLIGVPTWDPASTAGDSTRTALPALLRPIPESLALLGQEQPVAGPGDGGVTVTGTLVSADDGEPIERGRFLILNPGVSVSDYAEQQTTQFNTAGSEFVYADGRSDDAGRFVAEPPVQRNQAYGVIILASGYLGKVAENRVFADDSSPDTVDLGEIRMQSAR
jgi:S1-C subfamily serine protease